MFVKTIDARALDVSSQLPRFCRAVRAKFFVVLAVPNLSLLNALFHMCFSSTDNQIGIQGIAPPAVQKDRSSNPCAPKKLLFPYLATSINQRAGPFPRTNTHASRDRKSGPKSLLLTLWSLLHYLVHHVSMQYLCINSWQLLLCSALILCYFEEYLGIILLVKITDYVVL